MTVENDDASSIVSSGEGWDEDEIDGDEITEDDNQDDDDDDGDDDFMPRANDNEDDDGGDDDDDDDDENDEEDYEEDKNTKKRKRVDVARRSALFSRRWNHSRLLDRRWDERYALLARYKQDHGHCAVPHSYRTTILADGEVEAGGVEAGGVEAGGILLGRWLENQKGSRRMGRLSIERCERLRILGVQFVGKEGKKKKCKLLHHGRKEDDSRVVVDDASSSHLFSASEYASPPRTTSSSSDAPTTRMRRRRGAVVSPKMEERWESHLREFGRGKGRGAASSPAAAAASSSSSQRRWAENQRSARRRGTLSDDRVVLLDDANFDFGTSRGERWEENFRHLAGYRRRHGDCDVPRRYGPHPSLGRWVRRQRIELRNNGGRGGVSDDERYGRLAALGFCGSTGGGGGGGGGVAGRSSSPPLPMTCGGLRPTSLFSLSK